MKKLLALLFAGVLLVGVAGRMSFASDSASAYSADTGVKVNAKSAYAIEFDTGTPIYSHNEDKRLPIASMAKIMTLLLSYEHIQSGAMTTDSTVVVSQNAASMGGSQAFLDANKEYKVDDLLKSITIASANDSCVAMAEAISGSVDGFVADMNNKARELGMENTNFANCTGLPDPNGYSSAKDVSTMMRELLRHDKYYAYSTIWMDDLVHPGGRVTGLTNTNKLVRFYEGCDGGKTGYTSEAGHCLSATAVRGGMRLITVVIGEPDSKTRFKDVSDLFNFGFANYERRVVVDKTQMCEEQAPVRLGKSEGVSALPEDNITVFKLRKEKLGNIEVKYEFFAVKAPVAQGDTVGKAVVYKDGEVYKTVGLVASDSVDKLGYKDIVRKFFAEFSGK